MVSRLADAYRALAAESRQRVLANDLRADRIWGTETFGVTLQIDLGARVRDVVSALQAALDEREPGVFLFVPRASQHISVDQVVFWGGTYAGGQRAAWERIQQRFTARFLQLAGAFHAFDLTFCDLMATPEGIILCGYEVHDELQALRDTLHRELPFPAEATQRNDIIHTTVARYGRALGNPARLWEFVSHQRADVTMGVERVWLRKELVFPSLRTENIAYIDLV